MLYWNHSVALIDLADSSSCCACGKASLSSHMYGRRDRVPSHVAVSLTRHLIPPALRKLYHLATHHRRHHSAPDLLHRTLSRASVSVFSKIKTFPSSYRKLPSICFHSLFWSMRQHSRITSDDFSFAEAWTQMYNACPVIKSLAP